MLRLFPASLLVTALLWVVFSQPSTKGLEYIILPLALPFFAIALKRWIESRRNPGPALPRLSGNGPERDPMCYLTTAVTVFRVFMLFVVFAIFVVRSMPHSERDISVELAKSTCATEKPNALRVNSIVVSLMRDGKVYISTDSSGSQQIRPDVLTLSIANSVQGGAEKRLYIQSDARARYRMVKDVLDAARAANIENVTFLVERTKLR